MMQLGYLVTVAALRPKNLTMVIMDNGLYQITGAQATPAAGTAMPRWSAIGRCLEHCCESGI